MGTLAEYAKEKSKFLRVPTGTKVRVKYLGFKVVPSKWDEDEETVRYMFDLDGQEKQMDSKSLVLAEKMDEIEIGEMIEIGREGEGAQTKWSVKKVAEGGEEEKEKKEEDLPDLPFE